MKLRMFCSCLVIFGLSAVHAESDICRANAAGVVAEMRHSNEYPDMTEREIAIARQAALEACTRTFSTLQTDLEKARDVEKREGIDPSVDPIGWLKEQWHKEPVRKKGIERLKKRGH